MGFEGAEVAILDSGYTRHYADLKAWTYSEEFIDATWLMSTLARSGISAAVINDHDVEIGALSSYKALILPATSCMSSLAIDQIEAFATAEAEYFLHTTHPFATIFGGPVLTMDSAQLWAYDIHRLALQGTTT